MLLLLEQFDLLFFSFSHLPSSVMVCPKYLKLFTCSIFVPLIVIFTSPPTLDTFITLVFLIFIFILYFFVVLFFLFIFFCIFFSFFLIFLFLLLYFIFFFFFF